MWKIYIFWWNYFIIYTSNLTTKNIEIEGNVMKKFIVFAVISLIIIFTLTACNISAPLITLGNNFSNINLLCGACDDENYVYFIDKDKNYGIMRISKETNAVTDMGISTHFLGTLSIVDGYLYLDAGEYSGDECFIKPCKIDLSKIKDITYFDYETTGIYSVGDPVIIIDDTIYFKGGLQKINKDGTESATIDDHPYRVIGVENNSIYA